MSPPAPLLAAMSEAEFTRLVIRSLKKRGFLVTHFRPARVADDSYRTALSGHAGYPDITAVKNGQLLVLELKTDKGKKPTTEQQAWLDALNWVPGVVARDIRPSEWAAFLAVLDEA